VTSRGLEDAPVAAPPRFRASAMDASKAAPAARAEASPKPTNPQLIVGAAVAGAGAVGIAIGAVYGLAARRENDQALGYCQGGVGDSQGEYDRHADAACSPQTGRTPAYLRFGAGAAPPSVGGL